MGDGVAPGPKVSAAVDARCVAGKVQLVVKATNEHDGPVTLALATDYGTKTVSGLQSSKSVSNAFASRTAHVSAGEVSATSTAADGSTTTVEVSYAAKTCG